MRSQISLSSGEAYKPNKMSNQQILPVDQDFQSCWWKEPFKRQKQLKTNFWAVIFIVREEGGNRPVINLKNWTYLSFTSTFKWKFYIFWNSFWNKMITYTRWISKTLTLQFLSANNHPDAGGSGGQATSTNFSVFVLLWV